VDERLTAREREGAGRTWNGAPTPNGAGGASCVVALSDTAAFALQRRCHDGYGGIASPGSRSPEVPVVRRHPPPLRCLAALLGGLALTLPSCRLCDRCLAPREIVVEEPIAAPELVALTKAAPIERGKPRKVLDGAGWVFGIPSRIILWDRRVENHRVSATTEGTIAGYLADNDLDHVKVRINQYAPLEDWRRLRGNKTVGWPLRYTVGTLSVASEAIFPGRLLGGDHYNPWTATIHLYSDVPAIALHEGGHAKDFARRRWPGLYAVAFGLPISELYPEAIATGDALAYAAGRKDEALVAEGHRILYPAYGTYLGGAAGEAVGMTIGLPVYAGAVVAGHVAGRMPTGHDGETADAPAGESIATVEPEGTGREVVEREPIAPATADEPGVLPASFSSPAE